MLVVVLEKPGAAAVIVMRRVPLSKESSMMLRSKLALVWPARIVIAGVMETCELSLDERLMDKSVDRAAGMAIWPLFRRTPSPSVALGGTLTRREGRHDPA